MRITREALMKVVRDTVTQRLRTDRSIVSIYLTGSLLEEEYLLGGAADIDLVIVHNDYPGPEREIVPLTDTVHLDIAHHLHKDYRQTRRLRVHPWLGPTLNTCQILHDPQHLMDFTQASVRGQFDRPDFIMERARGQADHARQIWMGYHLDPPDVVGSKQIGLYLKAIDHAVNSIANLSGSPLTERRFLVRFMQRAEAARRPGLYPGLLGLLGGPNAQLEVVRSWLPNWEAAYLAMEPGSTPSRLHLVRKAYYLEAFKALLDSPQPLNVLWPLLHTWTYAVQSLPEGSSGYKGWEDAFDRLGLLGEGFEDRLQALDVYLDQIEERLESWAKEMGAAS